MEIVKDLIRRIPHSQILCDAGLSQPSWMQYVAAIDSKDVYIKIVADYLRFHLHVLEHNPNATDTETVIEYFDKLHVEGKNAPSTLQSKLSAIGKFWQFGKGRDLQQEASIIQHKINTRGFNNID